MARNAKVQAVFARRLTIALKMLDNFRHVKQVEIARRMNKHQNTISAWKKPGYKSGPPDDMTIELLEDVIGVPRGSLTRDDPDDFEVLKHPPVSPTVREPGIALHRAASFVRSQLQVYTRANLPVPPQIAVVLIAELESAMGEGPGAGGADGVKSGNGPPGGG